jgi:hypothetical protein
MIKREYFTFLVFPIIMLALPLGCRDSSTGPLQGELEFLGFDDKFALRMVWTDPYLYICAGSDGVWRRDMQNKTNWEYLGLRDTSLGRYTNVGALDIDIYQDDILVAYNNSSPYIEPENTVGIWRSIDGGKSWIRSDTGIPESITDPYEHNVITSLQRSPHLPNILIGWIDPTMYRSTNGGSQWTMLFGQRGVVSGIGSVRWNPYQPGEVWTFGEAGLFYPYCFSTQNYGLGPKTSVNFDKLGFPSDGAVYDVAFDAGTPVYSMPQQVRVS